MSHEDHSVTSTWRGDKGMEGRRKKRKERTRMITGGLVTVYT